MNVRCPECKTLFRIADDKVGPKGVKLRCGRCKHVFVARREDAVEAGAKVPATDGGVHAERHTGSPEREPAARASAASEALKDTPLVDEPAWPPPKSSGDVAPPPWSAPDASWRSPESIAAGASDVDLDSPLGRAARDLAEARLPPEERTVLPPLDPFPEGRTTLPPLAPPLEESLPGRVVHAPPVRSNLSPVTQPDAEGRLPVAAPEYDDHTVVATPSWLGGVEDGIHHAQTSNTQGESWTPKASAIDVAAGEKPIFESDDLSVPPRSAQTSSLRAEELFGGESPAPSTPSVPRKAPATNKVELGRFRTDPIAPRPEPVVRPVARPTSPRTPRDRGRSAIVRASLAVLLLAAVFVLFVLWRNDFRLGSFAKMVAQAFAPRAAASSSQVPGIEVRNVQRGVFVNRFGRRILTVTGELRNGTQQAYRAVSVLVRFVDRKGNPIAERERLAVGLLEPPVLAFLKDANDANEAYRRRRERSRLNAGGKLDFMLVVVPMPTEMLGKRLRMLVEVTGAVASGA